VPRVCQAKEWGDGVVTIPSALWEVADRRFAPREHTSLTGKEDFTAFVKPRLAVGPKGGGQAESAALEKITSDDFAGLNDNAANDRYGFAKYFVNAAYKRTETGQTSEDEVSGLIARKAVKLAAKQTAEIEIPVSTAAAAGVTLIAAPTVSASLIDANNAIVGTSAAGTTAATDIFRTIAAEKSVAGGVWKLKLENTGSEETTVLVAGWTNSDSAQFALTAGKPNAAGQVGLQAKLSNNDAPILNAKVTARLNNAAEIVLYDDGKHADGAAGDGVYGAISEKLGSGDYSIEAKAETNGQTRFAAATFTIGATAATKTGARKISKK
jgi:hypothetical protein